MFQFLNNFPSGAPSKCVKVWDFLSDEELTEFVATAINTGTNAVLDTVDLGVASLSGAATTDDSGCNFQADAQFISLGLGKRVKLEGRFYVSETTSANVAVQSDLWFGLAVADTSMVASAPTDGIYFRKDDGDALLDTQVRAGSADITGSTGASTLVASTWTRLGIDVNMDATTAAKGTVTFYVDGTAVATLTVTGLPASTVFLSPFVAFQSGDNTGTKFVNVDYIAVESTR